MSRRNKIIVSVVGVLIITLALLGITYGYFLTRIEGNTNETSISITTANLRLVYRDGTPEVLSATYIQPGDTVYTKTFTVTNEGNASIDYEVYLENVINDFEHEEDLLVFITCESNIEGNTCNGYGDGNVTDDTPIFGTSIYPLINSKLISNTIEPASEGVDAEVHTYTLYLMFKDDGDQSADMNKKIEWR